MWRAAEFLVHLAHVRLVCRTPSMAQTKDATTPKRKERDELFPPCDDDIPRAVVTRIVKAKVASPFPFFQYG